jgi:hypothetical protein
MKQQLVGTAHHDDSQNMFNHFTIAGSLPSDDEANYEIVRMHFRLTDPSEVESLIDSLPRQDFSLLEWEEGKTTGLLTMVLKAASNAANSPASADVGGNVRAIKVKDLLRELSRDPRIPESEETAFVNPSQPRPRLRTLPIPNLSKEQGFSP